MNKTRIAHIRKIVYVLSCGGLLLHLKTALIESTDPFSPFSIGLLGWSLLPYVAILTALKKIPLGTLFATVVVFLFDLFMHLEVFVWPSRSTAALGLLFMPLWNLVLFVPVLLLIGYFTEKWLKKKNENRNL